jgi:hypothetical protein
MIALVKLAFPEPSNVLLFAVVGLLTFPQQTPFDVITAPPLFKTIPPELAPSDAILLAATVLTAGIEAGFVLKE